MSEQQVKGGRAQRLCLRGWHAGEGATKVHWGGQDWEEGLFFFNCFFWTCTYCYLSFSYLFLAGLGLPFAWGLSLVAMQRLLIVVTSLVAEHKL